MAACRPTPIVLACTAMNFDLFQAEQAQAETDRLTAGLNTEQARAVTTTEGPLLVLAGAGSGKTRVITHRIAYLVERCGVPPWQILAVTFSNKAAGEMRERIELLLGEASADLWLGTFHRIGVRLLRSFGKHAGLASSFGIYDRDDSQRMIKRSMAALNIDDKQLRPRTVASYMDRAKNRLQLPDDPDLPRSDRTELKCAEIYARYEAEMRRADAVDFGDLLMRPVQVLNDEPTLREHWGRRFRYVLVDEFQDTNHAQYELLRLLTAGSGNLCVVGDDDQSIYSWRGAEVQNILSFPDRFAGATVVKLEQNYRSTDVILAASGALVRQNRTRHDKTLWTDQKGGDLIAIHEANSDSDEADWIAQRIEALRGEYSLSEVAIFYRTNAQSRSLEEAMGRYRLPYVLIGGLRFYDRAEVKDLLAYCRLALNRDDTASWLRAVNTPKRGIGKTTVGRVEAIASAQSISVPEAARRMVSSHERFRGKDKLSVFVELMARIRRLIDNMSADDAGGRILEMSGLRRALQQEQSLENESRLENLAQLVTAMGEYAQSAPDPTLGGYLEQVALVTAVDRLDGEREVLSMMTMHAAKGLEYDVTFVCGLEDGLMPHGRPGTELRDTEEERRLLYVAMTRARKKMHLSYARLRWRFGEQQLQTPSPFLTAIPRDLLDRQGGRRGGFGRVARVGGSWQAQTTRPSRSWPKRATRSIQRDDGTVVEQIAERTETEEVVVQRQGTMAAGSQVKHKTFGAGQVIDVAGYGKLARVTVRFRTVGVKKVLARFLQTT
ncbi:MAG: UvrD-helicase domain-containing protein [Myxococcales bacterium]|nr:UvrD-helicase domain-containing protein [Myxococcales bacterium]